MEIQALDFLYSKELLCTAYDFYSYNSLGPFSQYSGERSHFSLTIKNSCMIKLFIKTPSNDSIIINPEKYIYENTQQEFPIIICNPAGRVIFKKKYNSNGVTFRADIPGLYLIKIWSKRIDNYYKIQIRFNSEDDIVEFKQNVFSPAMSNSDGSLFEKGSVVKRSNSYSNTFDRCHDLSNLINK